MSDFKPTTDERKKVEHLFTFMADRIAELEKERDALRDALSEIREVWAGSDGFIPETAPEGYLQRLLKQCYEISVKALKEVEG